MFGELVKRKGVMRNEASDKYRASRFTHHARQKGQAVLLATLIMFVVAAVGAGFILFVQSSMNLSQRAREEQEALLLAQAGLAFADAQLTEHGADWRPSILVDFDEFERSRRWHIPDKDNDWFGKYAARQVRDLLGKIQGAGGSFLLKVKYLPNLQVFKIISIGRPRPNSPVYRRLIGYKTLPLSDWIWVTAENEGNPDPLLFDADGDGDFEVLLGQAINWQLAQDFLSNSERDPFQQLPQQPETRLGWFRLRTWLGSVRAPVWDITTNFISTIRINSDLLWYGTNSLAMTDFVLATQTIMEVARTISHLPFDPSNYTDLNRNATVLVYDWQDRFQGFAVPSNFGTPPGSGFVLFPIGNVPRYMDGWERLGGVLPVRWVFNFSRRVEPRPAPTIDLSRYYDQTRDADPPYSQNGYYRQPDPLRGQSPVLDNDRTDDSPLFPTFGFYVLRYFDPNDPPDPNNPNDPRFLTFRGIYIDNWTDQQFVSNPPADAPAAAFNDNNNDYRPELAQVYDWAVKPPMLDPNNPTQLHPRRQQLDSGWLEDIDDDNDGLFSEDPVNSRDDDNDGRIDEDPDANYVTERNMVEVQLPFTYRTAAPNFYVPPGVEVRFDVVPSGIQNVVLQRTWLIRHDGKSFNAPDGTSLGNNRLVFIDPVRLSPFNADEAYGDTLFNEDPINFRDDDGDSRVDEDPPQMSVTPNGQIPTIVIFAEGNIRVSGQVAVSVKIVTPETIYIEGPLHPVTANATIELLAKRNVCLNFAAARTPIPSLDGLNPLTDRALLLPQFRIAQIVDPQSQVQGRQYLLPNFPANPQTDPRLPLFADLLGGSIGVLQFPQPNDANGDILVDPADPQGRSPSVTYTLMLPLSLPLSDDLQNNFAQLQNRIWTLRLILLHRGYRADENNNPVNNPWTNLEVSISFDDDNDGRLDEDPVDGADNDGDSRVDEDSPNRTRLYGPAEPMRTFPVASRWYQGDGRPVDPNDPTTGKEWGILDIPIPPNVLDLNGDSQPTLNELQLALQRLRVIVTSPVAGEVIPQGRNPVPYELAGIKLALYDEHGIPRPIWQASSSWFVLAQTIHAENGTIGIVPPPYFDPTAHPSWQQLIASTDPNWQTRFRQWQRLWSFLLLAPTTLSVGQPS